MPQLDLGTYSNITLWVLFCIGIMYLCIQDFIIETYAYYHIIKPLYRRFLKKTYRYHYALYCAVVKRRELYKTFGYFIYHNILLKLKKDSFTNLLTKLPFTNIRQKKFKPKSKSKTKLRYQIRIQY